MRSVFKYILIVLVLVSYRETLFAQVKVRATVSKDNILIGEPISLTLEAYLPLGLEVNWPASDSISGFEIHSASKLDTAESIDGKKLAQTLLLTSFDSGRQYIPPFEIMVGEQYFYTDSIPIEISYTPFDPDADYRDIKDIIEVVNPSVKVIPWVLFIVATITLATLIFFIMRRKKVAHADHAPVVPVLSPYEEAMSALRVLKANGSVVVDAKGYYSELNDILRNYLAREFGISTFERTNEELILQLSKLSMSKDTFISLAQALRMSDFVKFARYKPSETDTDKNVDVVRNSIEQLNKTVASAV